MCLSSKSSCGYRFCNICFLELPTFWSLSVNGHLKQEPWVGGKILIYTVLKDGKLLALLTLWCFWHWKVASSGWGSSLSCDSLLQSSGYQPTPSDVIAFSNHFWKHRLSEHMIYLPGYHQGWYYQMLVFGITRISSFPACDICVLTTRPLSSCN